MPLRGTKPMAHREFPRVPYKGAVVTQAPTEKQFEADDVSVGGVKVLGANPTDVGANVLVKLDFGNTAEPVVAEGKISWAVKRDLSRSGHPAFGITFLKLSPQYRSFLERFVDDQLTGT